MVVIDKKKDSINDAVLISFHFAFGVNMYKSQS